MSEHPAHALSTGSVVSRDTLIVDSIARQLAAVVGSASQRDIKVAANLYNACADRRRSAATSKDAVGALFSRWKIEKWPRTAAVESVMAVWTFAAEVSRDLNVATLLRASVATDPENVDVTAIELSQPRCLYARLGQDSKEAEQLLRAAVREAATELGVTVADADALGSQLWSVCIAIAAACRIGYWEDRVTVVKFGELNRLGGSADVSDRPAGRWNQRLRQRGPPLGSQFSARAQGSPAYVAASGHAKLLGFPRDRPRGPVPARRAA
ncbi:hypothetical protein MRX96_044075 [Rhipicephalus microplus]